MATGLGSADQGPSAISSPFWACGVYTVRLYEGRVSRPVHCRPACGIAPCVGHCSGSTTGGPHKHAGFKPWPSKSSLIMHTVIIFISLILLDVVPERKPPDMSAMMTNRNTLPSFPSLLLLHSSPHEIKDRTSKPKTRCERKRKPNPESS